MVKQLKAGRYRAYQMDVKTTEKNKKRKVDDVDMGHVKEPHMPVYHEKNVGYAQYDLSEPIWLTSETRKRSTEQSTANITKEQKAVSSGVKVTWNRILFLMVLYRKEERNNDVWTTLQSQNT